MSDTIDLLEAGTVFVTTANNAPLIRPSTIRLWRINSFGTPIEVTKESNND